ncbi:outer membrane beta-barrel protein [uncultured Aquimarina sp.]|uniref:outer membrane beta-barrel protein n=1 Tax=uncultured Aquimarina sp. TaxID=575652 RepID=UPI00260458FA|nr:outer membrane beta-barrel protein [uncultured Aquimarina sp.]
MRFTFILFFICFAASTIVAQHSIELTSGITISKLKLEDDRVFSETNSGSSIFINLGYQYEFGEKKKIALVASVEFLKRNSKLALNSNLGVFGESSIRFMQFGFSPKIRYFFSSKENSFRPFAGVGPTLRYNFEATDSGFDIDEEGYNEFIVGGVYNVGFNWSLSDKFGVLFEAGLMNDFQDNFSNFHSLEGNDDGKFFDYYIRTGVSYSF